MNYVGLIRSFFEFTNMPVCFGNRLCGYKNRGWTYITTSFDLWKTIRLHYCLKVELRATKLNVSPKHSEF